MKPSPTPAPEHLHHQDGQAGKAQERDIADQILSASAMLLGLCLTVIGVVRGSDPAKRLATIVDDILAVDALIFLVACFMSYAALRSRHLQRMHRVEKIADTAFLVGLAGLALACVLLAWTVF